MAKKKGLGRGLDALFINNTSEQGTVVELSIDEINPNRAQPRQIFEDGALSELADSIKMHGIIQPLAVRGLIDGSYEIIAGERRYRAARIAGLRKLPVVILSVDKKEAMELTLIENLQREDLNAIEEARGYSQLIDEFSLKQDEVASRVSKSRSAITNALRLLSLPDSVVTMIAENKLSAGHGRALLALPVDLIEKTAEEIVLKKMSVRAAENLCRMLIAEKKIKKISAKKTIYREVEISLSESLGRKIEVRKKGKTGVISIEFLSDEELMNFANKLSEEKK